MKLALAALLFASAAHAKGDPFAPLIKEMTDKGFTVKEKSAGRNDGLTALAVVYSPKQPGADRLEIYLAAQGKAYLGYAHPSAGERLELDPAVPARFTDLLGDGSRVLAYRATMPATRTTMLNVVKWKKFKFQRVATFQEASFLTLDGKPGIEEHRRPLGNYLQVACEDYGTMSRSAFKTTLHAAKNGELADVSGLYPSFYESEIDRKAKTMESLKPTLEQNAGEYLGLAISTYYDYQAIGRAKEGWSRLKEFFVLPKFAPPAAKACLKRMETDLRDQLGVPASWP